MAAPCSIGEYLQVYGSELGDRVLAQFPPLHSPSDPLWPELARLKRRPFPAQTIAIMGLQNAGSTPAALRRRSRNVEQGSR
jgi:hypothetical protein